MNKDKQIEEMAKDLGGTWVVDLEGNPHGLSEVLMQCDIETITEQLYEMNYRKASEVAREIFEDIDDIFIMLKPQYFVEAPNLSRKRVLDEISKLKKKYTKQE